MEKSWTKWMTRMLVLVFVFGLIGAVSFRTVSFAEKTDEPEAGKTEEVAGIEAGIVEIKKYGNIVLSISPESMQELGYEPGDVISVTIGSKTLEMPIGLAYSDVDTGEPICRFQEKTETEKSEVSLAINMGNLTNNLGIAEKITIKEAPGYRWVWNEGFDENTAVSISMVEKQGYADGLMLHQVLASGSLNREDYPDLTDEEFANFREIATTGMGVGTLYRSSSPINPVLNRNREADEALLMAGINTVMNMADHPDTMKQYDGYTNTYYSECNVIALNMSMACFTEDFRAQLAEGFRYLADNEGPYLIHCNEGKDRTGFAAAILECLMGASADEVVEDYMLTFRNFYGVEPGSEVYQRIAEGNLQKVLEKAFEIENFYDEKVDLAVCAEQYLTDLGMTKDEIAALKDNLSQDYGGLADDDPAESDDWDCSVDTEMNKELTAVFEDAVDGLLGVNYEPVALLAEQVSDTETEYCFLTRATTVYPDATPYYALVYASVDADGNKQLLDIWDFDIAGYLNSEADTEETAESDDWDCSVDTEITEDLHAYFEDAVDDLLGVNYEPVVLLAEKENDEGTDYCFLSRATAVYPGAEPYYAIACVLVNENGEAQLDCVREFLAEDFAGAADEPSDAEEPADAEQPDEAEKPADAEPPDEEGKPADAEAPDEASAPEDDWDCSVDTELTGDLEASFAEAFAGLLGVNYEPVALLAEKDSGDGTEYCFLTRATTVYPGSEPYYALGFIRENPDAEAELLDIWDISFAELMGDDVDAEILAGDWDCSVDTEVTEDLEAYFEDAVDGLLGVNYEPVVLLAEQEDDGITDYCFLGRAAAVYPDAEPYYVIAWIQVNADEEAQLQGIYDFRADGDADAAEVPADEDAPADTEEPEEFVPGDDWDFAIGPEMTDGKQDLFGKAVEGLLGVNYEPIALLAELETGEGTTSCFIGRATAVYPDSEPYYVLVFVQEHPDGEVELLDVWDIDISDYADFEDFAQVS